MRFSWLAKKRTRDGSRLVRMSRPVTRSQRSVGSVGANSGNLGRGQVVGSGPHNREAYQVIEEETDSHSATSFAFYASSFTRSQRLLAHSCQVKRRAKPEFKPSPIHSSTLSRLD